MASIADIFMGVTAKRLTAVDATPTRSHQHEIGGLPTVGALDWLGAPTKGERITFNASHIYVCDDENEPQISESKVTWYDSRHKQPNRSPEYRLYYYDSDVTSKIKEGDLFVIALARDGRLFMIFAPFQSTAAQQLIVLFGLKLASASLIPVTLGREEVVFPLRVMLESIGVDLPLARSDQEEYFSLLVREFGGEVFPSTREFSEFARKASPDRLDPRADPDGAILGWMSHEELLFKIYERSIIKRTLNKGFSESPDGVECFLKFSLSVQNRRKSRVGHAFENHLCEIFEKNKVSFERGRAGRSTENGAKPDFLFPSFEKYHDATFLSDRLTILGAKTSCKDRWRQILSEGDRVKAKHLITLEAAISEAQIKEMTAKSLQLVVPAGIHSTYSAELRQKLMSLSRFLTLVRDNEVG